MITEISKAFEAFEKMQSEHFLIVGQSLKAIEQNHGQVPDLMDITHERERAFLVLQGLLDNITTVDIDDDFYLQTLKSFSERLAGILSKEDELRLLVEKNRTEIIKHLGKMNHGKIALKGYGSVLV